MVGLLLDADPVGTACNSLHVCGLEKRPRRNMKDVERVVPWDYQVTSHVLTAQSFIVFLLFFSLYVVVDP